MAQPPRSTTPAQSDASSRLSIREYTLILVELALVLTIVWEFHLEERRHLLTALEIVVAGFAVHALLPLRFRLPWFCGLSVVALVVFLGPAPAAWGLAIGGGLIGISLLPISFGIRVLLLLAAAAGLVWLRNGSDAVFWPVVGSMFMFRLIVYMHAVRRERQPTAVMKTLAYFFMAPNVFFTLFPVVDYRTFCDGYYADRRQRIYQTGVHWLATGVGQLLLYRLVKSFLLPTPLEIRSVPDVVQFFVMNYALYLRVSAQFHLVCGMLHLFGFNLPRTHDNYFLASSFSDIWRRINIYWKDFLMKVVFFPAFFRLRRAGDAAAVVAGVLCVFIATWLAHSWQVFWLLGDFPLRLQDAALWLSVGALVAISSLWDFHRAKAGRGNDDVFSFVRATGVSLQTVGVFLCVCLFWARWTNREIFRFLLFGDSRLTCTGKDAALLGGWLLAAIAAVLAIQFGRHQARRAARRGPDASPFGNSAGFLFERSVALHVAALAVAVVAGVPQLYATLGPRPASLLAALQTDAQSGAEAVRAVEGYYEQLSVPATQASPFLGNSAAARDDRGGRYAAMTRPRRDILQMELIPGWRGEFGGAAISVNRWGMRDRDRTLEKPPGTFRIALVGSSPVMGYGVKDDETFAYLLEDQMNSDPELRGQRYEVLNFGEGSYSPLHRRMQIERKVLQFRPDLILYFAHQDELISSLQWLSRAVSNAIDLDDRCLDDIIRHAGITSETPDGVTVIRLGERSLPIVTCTYERLARACQSASVRLAWIYLPMPGVDDARINPGLMAKLAADAGIETLDLSGWSDSFATKTTISDSDYHPSVLGHRLIAARLIRLLRSRPDLLKSPD